MVRPMANPINVIIVGQALDSQGFVGANNTVEGLGLNTFGFLWPDAGIWTPCDPLITTTWTECPICTDNDIV